MMADLLLLPVATGIVAFVVFNFFKSLLAFRRFYDFINKQDSKSSPHTEPSEPQDQTIRVSHSWSEAAVVSTRKAEVVFHAGSDELQEECAHSAKLCTVSRSEEEEEDQDRLIRETTTGVTKASVKAEKKQGVQGNNAKIPSNQTGSGSYKYVQNSNEFSTALKQDWQSGQLICVHCEVSLSGQRYIIRSDRPYCKICYEALFANTCDKCHKTINFDARDLSYENHHWHEQCFVCTGCHVPLSNKLFTYKDGSLFCQKCYESRICKHCSKCGKEFQQGMKKFGYKDKQWHDECFTCSVCCQPIGKNAFVSRDTTRDLICVKCLDQHNKIIAGHPSKCVKCKQAILPSEKVVYKNSSWHKRCFACAHCSRHLSNARSFILIDSQILCCSECCHEVYDKRCFSCRKPINAEEDRTLIAFGDRNWHSKCFKCKRCELPLVGRGFLTDGHDIVCPYCVK